MQEHFFSTPRSARYFTLGSPQGATDVWIVCHGYGQLASRFLERFRALESERRCIVAPEGLSRFYLTENPSERRVGASWMTKEDRLHEIDDYVRYLDTLHTQVVPGNARVTALGFSQGTATVCRWAAFGAARIDRVMVWGGGVGAGSGLRSGGCRGGWRPGVMMFPGEGGRAWPPGAGKESAASSTIALPTPRAAATITGVSALGRMWRARMRSRRAPTATAPSTNGRAASDRTSPGTSRAIPIHPVSPNTVTTSAVLGCHSAASNTRSTTRGTARAKSVSPSSVTDNGPRQ